MLKKQFDYWDGDCLVAWTFTTEPYTEDFCPDCDWQITLSRTLDTSRTTCSADYYYEEDLRYGKISLEGDWGVWEYIVGGLESAAYGTRGYLGYFYYDYGDSVFLDEGMPDVADRWYYTGWPWMAQDGARFKMKTERSSVSVESTGTRYYGEIFYAYGEVY